MPHPNRPLTPANQNPWYVLMTLYGEQDGEEVDWELHEKNRQAWNAWACQGMTDEERQTAANKAFLTVHELSAWEEIENEVAHLHQSEMIRRNYSDFTYPGIPTHWSIYELSDHDFNKHLCLRQFIAPNQFECKKSFLQFNVDFSYMTFQGAANFSESEFNFGTKITRTFFSNVADFSEAKFLKNANFNHSTFSDSAFFSNTTFHEKLDFFFVKFEMESIFTGAKFLKDARFTFTRFYGNLHPGLFTEACSAFGFLGVRGPGRPLSGALSRIW